MNGACGREWTRKFMSTVFTSVFLAKKYKEHREKVIFDQERALLPATQPLVENIIRREKITEELAMWKERQNKINAKMDRLRREFANTHNPDLNAQRRDFVKACPDPECRGFLSSQWKCGICEKWACPTCHEIKGDTRDADHTCNPDTVATVTLLAGDTRPCPKCQMGIFKIDGCDQMWCTACHTAFNWRTNRIENVVHNPHYFEWLRRNGNAVPRNPGDIPCHNELTHMTYNEIRRILTSPRFVDAPLRNECDSFVRAVIQNTLHLRYAVMGRYREVNYVERNQSLRVGYMRNQITEDKFKTQLQMNEKKNQKTTDIRNVLNVLMTTVTDIILRFHNYLASAPDNNFDMAILEEIVTIVDYANDCFLDISTTYKSKRLHVANDIRID
jgi:hypothetical protein